MRQIICRFQDGPTFLKHIRLPADRRSGEMTFSFLGDFGLRIGETLRVVLIIQSLGERHDLHLTITGRLPSKNSADASGRSSQRWRYETRATREDQIWMEMLVAKCATQQRISPAA